MSTWLWRHWFSPWLLEQWRVRPCGSAEAAILARVDQLAAEMRLPSPKLYMIDDFSPNAVFLIPSKKHASFVLTEGLLRALNADELDAVLCHGLSQMRLVEFRVAPWLVLPLAPMAKVLNILPPSFRILLSFWPQMLTRALISPERFRRADRRVANFQQNPRILAAALQKASALSRKIPLHSRNWVWNHLFWISPVEQEFPIIIRTHPTMERRLAALLKPSFP